MRLKDEICKKCFLPNYYDMALQHQDSKDAGAEINERQKFCTYCKYELDG